MTAGLGYTLEVLQSILKKISMFYFGVPLFGSNPTTSLESQ